MLNDKKNILITGGSGFIGQHLAKKFLENNYEVTIGDINKPENVNYEFIQGDMMNFDFLKEIVEDKDIVIHLVGLADAGAAQKDPMKSFQLNVVSLQNVLEASRIFDVEKLIFPSSAAVYGIVDDLPIKENFPPNPTNIYSWHKLICEKMIQAYEKNYGLKYVILRLFNVYGKGNKGVIGQFIEKAKKGEVIESFGPYQYRDFVYAGDVAEAMFRAAVYDKAINRIVNIGSGRGTQIREILDIVCELFPSAQWKEVKTNFVMYDSIADITLARILLDFEPHSSPEFMKKVIVEEMING